MDHLFWIDLEMTGLNPTIDKILEVACIVTDLKLKPLATFEAVVFQPPEVLAKMDAWCTETHGKSGLTAKIPAGITEDAVDNALVALAKPFFKRQKIVLSGNSVFQDRRFIDVYLPQFSKLLHYRLLDVSSFKIIFEHMFKNKFKKQNRHRAIDDIEESIGELAHYLQFIQIPLVPNASSERSASEVGGSQT